jgi:hypothetical protein
MIERQPNEDKCEDAKDGILAIKNQRITILERDQPDEDRCGL